MDSDALLLFVKSASRSCNIKEFSGDSVAVCGYSLLSPDALACYDTTYDRNNPNVHIQDCLKYLRLMETFNLKPIIVMPGKDLAPKKQNANLRRNARRSPRIRKRLLENGSLEDATKYLKDCVGVSHEMAMDLIKICHQNNVDCLVAPYGAEAQLAYLNQTDIVDFVITENPDVIMFGCRKIVFNLDLEGFGTLVERDKLIKVMKLPNNQYCFDKFLYMYIMSGCYYLDPLPGIAFKNARKAISLMEDSDIYNLLRRLPQCLNLRHLVVPNEYIENFKLAVAAVKHQVVFDLVHRQLVCLSSPETSGISAEYLTNAGTLFDNGKAFQIAVGNIHPITSRILDEWDPNKDPEWVCEYTKKPSIWSLEAVKPTPAEKSTDKLECNQEEHSLLKSEGENNDQEVLEMPTSKEAEIEIPEDLDININEAKLLCQYFGNYSDNKKKSETISGNSLAASSQGHSIDDTNLVSMESDIVKQLLYEIPHDLPGTSGSNIVIDTTEALNKVDVLEITRGNIDSYQFSNEKQAVIPFTEMSIENTQDSPELYDVILQQFAQNPPESSSTLQTPGGIASTISQYSIERDCSSTTVVSTSQNIDLPDMLIEEQFYKSGAFRISEASVDWAEEAPCISSNVESLLSELVKEMPSTSNFNLTEGNKYFWEQSIGTAEEANVAQMEIFDQDSDDSEDNWPLSQLALKRKLSPLPGTSKTRKEM